MVTGKVSNYVIAGLDSYLLENGKVRLFKNSRNHRDSITPHSHRFNFTCLVLKGHVVNEIWNVDDTGNGDIFLKSTLSYSGKIGEHSHEYDMNPKNIAHYRITSEKYCVGDTYGMRAHDIHSIRFSKGAVVLFFEGPTLLNTSDIIEPIVNNKLIKTYKKESYMFLQDKNEK